MVAVEVEKGLERLRQHTESGRAQRTRLRRFNDLEIRHPTPATARQRLRWLERSPEPAQRPSAQRSGRRGVDLRLRVVGRAQV